MNSIFLSMLLFLLPLNSNNSIYEIQVETIEGNTTSLSTFQGQKMVIAVFDYDDPDDQFLSYLEDIKKGGNVNVIAVPALEFGAHSSSRELLQVKKDLGLTFLITQPQNVKKSNPAKQSGLFKWLTHVSENTHFDEEIENDQQMYIISEQGTLYALIGKGTAKEVVTDIINHNVQE